MCIFSVHLVELEIEEGDLRKRLLKEIYNLKKQLQQESAEQVILTKHQLWAYIIRIQLSWRCCTKQQWYLNTWNPLCIQ